MTETVTQSYAPLLLYLILAAGLATVLLLASSLIGRHLRSRTKSEPYECGIIPPTDAREPFSVKFYLVAMIFILFDVEAVFLYPWAYIFRDIGWFGFSEMLLYIVILLVGYVYLLKKGALDWNRSAKRRESGR